VELPVMQSMTVHMYLSPRSRSLYLTSVHSISYKLDQPFAIT